MSQYTSSVSAAFIALFTTRATFAHASSAEFVVQLAEAIRTRSAKTDARAWRKNQLTTTAALRSAPSPQPSKTCSGPVPQRTTTTTMVKKRVDDRVKRFVEEGVRSEQRSLIVLVGDHGKDQVVNLHQMLARARVAARPSVLWCYKKS